MVKLTDLIWKNDRTTSNIMNGELKKTSATDGGLEAVTVPICVGSFLAWPTFWVCKGIQWNFMTRGSEGLPLFIRKTYFQAKLMQILILTTGLAVALACNSVQPAISRNIDEN